VAVAPFGKYVYVGHGGADVEVFEIDQATGGLALQQRHGTPAVAALAMHPGGKYLFAAEADGAGGTDIAVKRIDPTTGRLVDLSRAPVTGAGPVVAMAADPAGKHVHVMRETQLTTFAIDAAGALTAVNSFTMARATSIALLK